MFLSTDFTSRQQSLQFILSIFNKDVIDKSLLSKVVCMEETQKQLLQRLLFLFLMKKDDIYIFLLKEARKELNESPHGINLDEFKARVNPYGLQIDRLKLFQTFIIMASP